MPFFFQFESLQVIIDIIQIFHETSLQYTNYFSLLSLNAAAETLCLELNKREYRMFSSSSALHIVSYNMSVFPKHCS